MTQNPENFAWIILLLPLAAAVVITLFTRPMRHASAMISIGAIGVGFLLSLFLMISLHGMDAKQGVSATPFNWVLLDQFKVDIGLHLDALSLLMLLVVTGVGLMIHIYSY